MIKRFFTSGITALILLSALWLTGVDSVIKSNDQAQKNIQKYYQTMRWLSMHYVDEVDLTDLYKNSIRGMVKGIDDSTLVVEGTPVDTTFSGLRITGLEQAAVRFEVAYSALQELRPDTDMDEATEFALSGMLENLDPYTVYIDPRQSRQVRENFAGSFQGIGVQFDIINDTITVVSPISGGPSDQLGIRSGDRIIEIDGESSVGFNTDQVQSSLRGEKGSVVRVGIKRPGMSNTLNFNIERDDIPLYTIDSNYMLDESTGYIKVNRFASTTFSEFMEAMEDLKEEGMERVILDMRSNPGGYMDETLRMTSQFFERGVPLVKTRGRLSRFNFDHNTRINGRYSEMPVIVLINEGSASASEILAGAIQDNDRGLVVGRRSFGKGLVQQQYELVDESFIRVTISRYYTPSGRLIQKPFEDGREEYAFEIFNRDRDASSDVENFISELPDSLVFKTNIGRSVYGGGGIIPDHIVQADTTRSYVLGFMRQNNIGFEFVRDYLDNYGDEFRAEWEDDFERFRTDFTWHERHLDQFWATMKDRGMILSDTTETATYDEDTLYINPKMIERDAWIPAAFTKADLARQVWGQTAYFPVYNDYFDNMLPVAMGLWEEVYELAVLRDEFKRNRATGEVRLE